MDVSPWLWLSFNLGVLALLAFDLGLLNRGPREIGAARALKLSAAYVGLALLFNAGVFWRFGRDAGLDFLAGYLIEKSLSLDNVFVIALIFTALGVPARHQHRVLFWGILGALAMRAVLIFAGIGLIEQFRWIVYVFGAFLALTGLRMLASVDRTPDPARNPVVLFLRARLRVTEDFQGDRFIIRRDGLLYVTPLFIALVLVELTDLVFAVDSIPAILAITTDPFIVYTSNVFAILGLRALYFALADIIHRFHYLRHALALLLILIGVKMALVDLWKIPTLWALIATAGLLGGAILLSLARGRRLATKGESA
jgi:tellurite resistance protein TerC